MPPEQRARLLEIAQAWEALAREAGEDKAEEEDPAATMPRAA